MNRLENQTTRHIRKALFILPLLMGFSSLLSNPLEAAEVKSVIKVPEVYLVKKGDHLWKLSDEEYQNPHKWRYLWENNDYIDNPDLIYPGDRILIPGSFVDKEVVEIVNNAPVKNVVAKPEPTPLTIVSESLYAKSGYISDNEKWDGVIIHGIEDKVIFGKGDTIYTDISGKNVKKGDIFTVLKEMRKVRHPVTRKNMGILVQEVGVAVVSDIGDGNSTVEVLTSYSNIELGDYLIKRTDSNDNRYDPTAAKKDREIEGYIIEGKDERSTYGRGDVVYIDAGKKDNILPGDTFIVYDKGKEVKTGERFSRKTTTLPIEILSKIQVFRVGDKTSTAIVIDSKKETNIGAPIRYIKE